ncbi:haus augmin-like complex subunit 8 isoform x1 [Diplodia corticola]|uniref:Haus augmin-like complex subunit 8 isoform x1 n=1 Tax=Diplodia corticola TaxID=236234 RepID=A0A1J9RMN7_9PEZI|nr:haus augmin-like complex subunit 8 isoform x1 [Diplodia corticola]OJD29775.1 haus augmin-like complex subunit 8 isoform x1 [Diplodia corticola]
MLFQQTDLILEHREAPHGPLLAAKGRDRRSDVASMLPAAKASLIPVPTALRPAGEIKVRKRRENRSSASSTGGALTSICSEGESGLAQLCGSPLNMSVQGSPPSIVEPESPTLLHRKSSKNRVFSKVLGSIQASRSNPALQPTRNGQSDGSIFRKLSMRRRPSFPSRSKSSEFQAQPSTPSILTASSSRTNLRPGQFSAKSSRSDPLQPRSTQMADQTSPRSRSATREPPPILSVDLNTVTECESLSLHEERSVWVAVETRGVVRPDVRDLGEDNKGAGLDVVVILDNSRFASPDSQETACDVALRIAQISTGADDRFAVFCTCCRHFPDEAKTSGCLLHPLQAVNVPSLHRELNDIRALVARPPAAGTEMSETLQEAIKALSESKNESAKPLRLTRCLVFILSPRSVGGLERMDQFSALNVYVVCTAAIPYHNGLSENSDLWMLPRSLSSNSFSQKVSVNDSAHLISQAADVMSYAREGRVFGSITDLCVDIKPRQGCVVESILGSTSSAKLKAGQTLSALVRVRIPAVITREHAAHNPLTELEDALEGLETLLGETVTDVLTISAHYKQSCFPDNNSITVEQVCTVRRPNPLSEWSIEPPTDPAAASKAEAKIYRRLIFLMATQDPPYIALDALDAFYRHRRYSLPCSGYIEYVRRELVYQLGATPLFINSEVDGFPLPASAFSPTLPAVLQVPEIDTSYHAKDVDGPHLRQFASQPHFSFDARDSLCFFTATNVPASRQAQRSVPATPLTDTRSCNPSASPRFSDALDTEGTATAQEGKCTSTSDDAESSSLDEARAIWRHMRRNVSIRASSPSRGTPSWPMGYRSLGQRTEMAREYRERELKKKALANKRSIGADTLRSLAMGSEANVSEAGAAPWLL